jgi:hypothetical protein
MAENRDYRRLVRDFMELAGHATAPEIAAAYAQLASGYEALARAQERMRRHQGLAGSCNGPDKTSAETNASQARKGS